MDNTDNTFFMRVMLLMLIIVHTVLHIAEYGCKVTNFIPFPMKKLVYFLIIEKKTIILHRNCNLWHSKKINLV